MPEIHPQLQKDCLILGRFPLSYLLLSNDRHYPWFILVPDRSDIGEIYQLSDTDRNQLWQESTILSVHIMSQFKGDKLNVAALGNMVPQLHLHHVVRYRDDAAWPAPIWGKVEAKPYSDDQLSVLMQKLDVESLADFKC